VGLADLLDVDVSAVAPVESGFKDCKAGVFEFELKDYDFGSYEKDGTIYPRLQFILEAVNCFNLTDGSDPGTGIGEIHREGFFGEDVVGNCRAFLEGKLGMTWGPTLRATLDRSVGTRLMAKITKSPKKNDPSQFWTNMEDVKISGVPAQPQAVAPAGFSV
jgi:hypothetical protein